MKLTTQLVWTVNKPHTKSHWNLSVAFFGISISKPITPFQKFEIWKTLCCMGGGWDIGSAFWTRFWLATKQRDQTTHAQQHITHDLDDIFWVWKVWKIQNSNYVFWILVYVFLKKCAGFPFSKVAPKLCQISILTNFHFWWNLAIVNFRSNFHFNEFPF